MIGFVRAVAVDLDGTIAYSDVVSSEAIAALDECRARGQVTVLVTGRIEDEFTGRFPDLATHFDALVFEDGAVIVVGEQRHVAEPVDQVLLDSLRRLGVDCRTGRAILACRADSSAAVAAEVNRLGLDAQIVRNRSELMVVPAGTSKGNGLAVALSELGISVHNAIAIGDAENDLSMMRTAEVGVAVAGATESARAHADLVIEEPGGAGVAQFLRGRLVAGIETIHPARRELEIGLTSDGTPVTVPGSQATILISGESGSGKSYLSGLLAEKWIDAGYSILIIDPEGDHVGLGQLRPTVVVDAVDVPSTFELLQVIRRQPSVVVLDLSGLSRDEVQPYVDSLAGGVEALRSQTGLPHWIVTDEAHASFGDQGSLASVFHPNRGGYCYVTYRPDLLCQAARASIDIELVAQGPSGSAGDEAWTATCRRIGQADSRFIPLRRTTMQVRHVGKYLRSPLPTRQQFTFRDASGRSVGVARTVQEFLQQVEQVIPPSMQHHAARGDFSRWALGSLQDRDLAVLLAAAESEFSGHLRADLGQLRKQVTTSVRSRYDMSAVQPPEPVPLPPSPPSASSPSATGSGASHIQNPSEPHIQNPSESHIQNPSEAQAHV